MPIVLPGDRQMTLYALPGGGYSTVQASSPISIALSSLDEGATLTITTDGTYSFGNAGPTLLYYDNFSSATDGVAISGTPVLGRGTVSTNAFGYPLGADLSGMPYGKGIQIGNGGSDPAVSNSYRQIIVVDTEVVTESYEHTYFYNPSANQAAQISGATAAAAASHQWQIKSDWEMNTNNGNGDPAYGDIFGGTPDWNVSLNQWNDGGKFSGNDAPSSTFDTTDPGFMDPNNAGYWRSVPVCRQIWKKCGPTAGSGTGSKGMYRITDTVTGLIEEKDYTDTGVWTGSSNSPIGWDRRKIPGFVRGFQLGLGAQIYYGEIYRAVGPAACARVEIGDAATYAACKKIAICTVDTWADTQAVATVRKGVFHGESLVGKYVYITNSSNETVLAGQIEA